MERMAVLDAGRLTKAAIAEFDRIFDKYRKREFLPMNRCYRDPDGTAPDTEMLSALGIGESLDDLRARFCREPLVRCGRKDPELDAL